MQRCSDCARPDSELASHDLDAADVGDMNPTGQLVPNGIEQHFSGRGDTAADHDPIDAEEHDYVAHSDPKVSARLLDASLGASISGARCCHRFLDPELAARRGNRIRLGQRLETSAVAAVAQRTIGEDRLVAELSGCPFEPEVRTSVEDQPSADPGAESDAEHRVGATTGPEPVLGQRERASVVDQPRREFDRAAYGLEDLQSVP